MNPSSLCLVITDLILVRVVFLSIYKLNFILSNLSFKKDYLFRKYEPTKIRKTIKENSIGNIQKLDYKSLLKEISFRTKTVPWLFRIWIINLFNAYYSTYLQLRAFIPAYTIHGVQFSFSQKRIWMWTKEPHIKNTQNSKNRCQSDWLLNSRSCQCLLQYLISLAEENIVGTPSLIDTRFRL